MASKIKETPVLTGKAADRFAKATKANESKKVTPESYQRALRAFERIAIKNA